MADSTSINIFMLLKFTAKPLFKDGHVLCYLD